MENPSNDVNGNSSPVVSEDVETQDTVSATPTVAATNTVTQPIGSQTPSENLYAALAEERRMRKEAEDKLKNLNTVVPAESDVFSDEGRILNERIARLEDQLALEKVYSQFPQLKDKKADFEAYRAAEHPRAKTESVAKLYLAENGLLEPRRVGLEKATGGPRIVQPSGLTTEEVERLRTKEPRRYREMLMKGEIKFGS